MFAARQRPLLVLEDRLLAMRLSLNTPVLSTAELPSGPARAAICSWAEGSARRFAVAVRALRGGAAVVYELQHEVPPDADGWSVALDASLSFGESMGFVFDDELVADRRPETLRRAVGLLRELVAPGDGDLDLDSFSSPAASAGDAVAEILLEDELDALAAEPDDGAAAAGAAPAFAAGVALSKFRSPPPQGLRAAAPPAKASAPESPTSPAREVRGGATLGRVRPVRVRVEAESGPTADPLLRLLADF